MHAPLFHPAMKNVAPIRKDLGVKTFFNMLGPMVNPAFPKRQMVGVFSLELARQYGYLYQNTDKDFVILHSVDGYDEVSLTGPVKYFCNEGEKIVEPKDLGLTNLTRDDVRGGDTVEESAKIFMNVLENKATVAQRSAVIANAAMALYAANRTAGLENAVARATEALESGKALSAFRNLIGSQC
ncbi:MAG TPA: anthranilate phosphoribosyltransferase, partial [Chryseosolibacter sp.]|nr:anthranilate phosphoribosyltransferase [Chryseosolibacter sp.]